MISPLFLRLARHVLFLLSPGRTRRKTSLIPSVNPPGGICSLRPCPSSPLDPSLGPFSYLQFPFFPSHDRLPSQKPTDPSLWPSDSTLLLLSFAPPLSRLRLNLILITFSTWGWGARLLLISPVFFSSLVPRMAHPHPLPLSLCRKTFRRNKVTH